MEFHIREAREKAGYSQKELAQIIGVAQNTFHGYESGKHDPKSEHLARIAEVCDVTVDFLLGRSFTEAQQKKNSPSVAEAAPGEEVRGEIIRLAGTLTDEQKELFLAILRLTAARNQGLPVADLVSAGEAALKSELQNPTR